MSCEWFPNQILFLYLTLYPNQALNYLTMDLYKICPNFKALFSSNYFQWLPLSYQTTICSVFLISFFYNSDSVINLVLPAVFISGHCRANFHFNLLIFLFANVFHAIIFLIPSFLILFSLFLTSRLLSTLTGSPQKLFPSLTSA